MKHPDYLGVFTYPNAFIYSDRTVEEHGDYKQIAAVYFRPVSIKIFSKNKKYADAVAIATAEYNHILNNINTPIETSSCGQTVMPCVNL